MDQLRKAWAVLARHHFWVLIVVTTAIAVYCWYSGASTLATQFKSNKSTIEQGFSAVQSVQSQPFKANAEVNEKQQEQITLQNEAVKAMWRQLYDRQRADVLKWPANLSENFRNRVEGLNFLDEIERDLRDHYNNYVRDHFPNLPKIVGAKLAPEGEAGGMSRGRSYRMTDAREMGGPEMHGGAAAIEEEESLVDWLDQDRVRQQLYVPSTPSSKRIWKTQEDLWVYEALLKIVAATNKAANADRNSNAAVREIQSIEVGQPAAQQSRGRGRIDMIAPSAGGGEMGGEFGGEFAGGGGREMMMEGGPGSFGSPDIGGDFGDRSGMGFGTETADVTFANRYVDENGAPIAAEDPASFGKEFKRLPVRLQLVMDERWLPQLITECANAPLQVDVQEVRINPSNANESGGGFSRGMSMPGAGEAMIPDPEPSVKTVVIQGIIYIFNPPGAATASDQVAGVE